MSLPPGVVGPVGPTITPNFKNRSVDYYTVSSTDFLHLGSFSLLTSLALAFGSLLLGVAASALLTHQYASNELKTENGWMLGAGFSCAAFGAMMIIFGIAFIFRNWRLMTEIKKSVITDKTS